MDTSRLEELLEQLIGKQDELISRIESLEARIDSQLTEVNSNISDLNFSSSQIYEELNWWGEKHSLAKQVLGAMKDIEMAVSQN